jgi:hypothetical protein
MLSVRTLLIEIPNSRIRGIFEKHGAQHRNAGLVRRDGLRVEVRHELVFEVDEVLEDFGGFFRGVDQPWNLHTCIID